ncbi:hypothetical protein [Pandoraea anhela]|uniref:Uncharacterized protein n=1 Tax=Pandoraea anhela TaxID=2508295 RepID=A0A5E4SIE8_9BURK|nr:hypothetical protein [Pandoraea anhela]VVD73809.1 hypothetical protein PAN31108_00739 [Pandoraea anhela]
MGHPTPPGGLRPDEPDPAPTPRPTPSSGCGASFLIDVVRGHGGTLAHVLGALGKFRLRHGHWPSHIYLYPETLAALVQDLTPLGFYRVQQRLDVAADLERDLYCADDCGNVAIYRLQAASDPASIDAAAVWLGLMLPGCSASDSGLGPCATPTPPR